MKLSHKLLASFLVFDMLLMFIFAFLVSYLMVTKATMTEETERVRKITGISLEIAEQQHGIQRNIFLNFLENNTSLLEEISSGNKIIDMRLGDISSMIADKDARDLLESIFQIRKSVMQTESKLISEPSLFSRNRLIRVWSYKTDMLNSVLDDLAGHNMNQLNRNMELMESTIRRITLITFTVFVLSGIFIALLYFYINRVLTVSIEKLSVFAGKIAGGDFETEVSVADSGTYEINLLKRSINEMRQN